MTTLHPDAPNLGDPDIEGLTRLSVIEMEGAEPKPGIAFIVDRIEIVLTADQLRALAEWADPA